MLSVNNEIDKKDRIDDMVKILHNLCENCPCKVIKWLEEHDNYEYLIFKKNNAGNNMLMILCNSVPHTNIHIHNRRVAAINDFIVSKYMSHELLWQQNNSLNTVLHIMCKNYPELVNPFLKLSIMSEDFLLVQNKTKHTSLHVSCEYNHESVYDIMKSQFCTRKLLMVQNSVGSTALHMACMYGLNLVKFILGSEFCSPELLMQVDSFYYTDSVGGRGSMAKRKRNYNPLMFACRFFPHVVNTILTSEHCTNSVLLQTDLYNMHFNDIFKQYNKNSIIVLNYDKKIFKQKHKIFHSNIFTNIIGKNSTYDSLIDSHD